MYSFYYSIIYFSMLFFIQMSRSCFRCLNDERLRLCNGFWCRKRTEFTAAWDQFKISIYQIFLWLWWSRVGYYVRSNALKWWFRYGSFFCFRERLNMHLMFLLMNSLVNVCYLSGDQIYCLEQASIYIVIQNLY